jgi:hypothetical protein
MFITDQGVITGLLQFSSSEILACHVTSQEAIQIVTILGNQHLSFLTTVRHRLENYGMEKR